MGAEAFPPCFPKENATTMGAEAFPPCFPKEDKKNLIKVFLVIAAFAKIISKL
jgi:hypothetical protein